MQHRPQLSTLSEHLAPPAPQGIAAHQLGNRDCSRAQACDCMRRPCVAQETPCDTAGDCTCWWRACEAESESLVGIDEGPVSVTCVIEVFCAQTHRAQTSFQPFKCTSHASAAQCWLKHAHSILTPRQAVCRPPPSGNRCAAGRLGSSARVHLWDTPPYLAGSQVS